MCVMCRENCAASDESGILTWNAIKVQLIILLKAPASTDAVLVNSSLGLLIMSPHDFFLLKASSRWMAVE